MTQMTLSIHFQINFPTKLRDAGGDKAIQIPFIIAFYTNTYAYIENNIYFQNSWWIHTENVCFIGSVRGKIIYEITEKEASSQKNTMKASIHQWKVEKNKNCLL